MEISKNSDEDDEEEAAIVRATPSDIMSPEMYRKTPEVYKGLSNILMMQQDPVPYFMRNNYMYPP